MVTKLFLHNVLAFWCWTHFSWEKLHGYNRLFCSQNFSRPKQNFIHCFHPSAFRWNYLPKRWKWSSQKKLFKLICNGCPIGTITLHFVFLIFVHWFDIVNNRLKSLLTQRTFGFNLWWTKCCKIVWLTAIYSQKNIYLRPLQ